MASLIVVEDGTGVSGANSFVTEAEATTYCTLMGDTTWAAATSVNREAALARAGRYLNGLSWLGRKVSFSNSMCWPRREVPNPDYPEDSGTQDDPYLAITTIPQQVKDAQCEAALRELATKDSLSPDLARGGAVQSEKVGDLEVTYAPGAARGTVMQAIDRLLTPFLTLSCNTTMKLG